MTRAPNSPRMRVQKGPAMRVPSSSTFTPSRGRMGSVMVDVLSRAAFHQGLGDGAGIGMLDLAAHRKPPCDAAHPEAPGTQKFGNGMGRDLALVGEVGGHDHLLHRAVGGPSDELFQVQL